MLDPSSPLPQVLESRLTTKRLAPYRAATGNSLVRALDLYRWNSEIAGAMFLDLGHLEVFLRNALDEQLTRWYAGARNSVLWFEDQTGPLDENRLKDIEKARSNIEGIAATKGRTLTPDELHSQLVAGLMMGFWTFLLDNDNERPLWTHALRNAFPHLSPQERSRVHTPLIRLKNLRNRIAHHEPIHSSKLGARHAELLRIVSWIDPSLISWIQHQSTVDQILARKPKSA